MFTHAHLFDQPLDHLDVSSLNYINGMFYKSGMSDKHILDFVRRVAETNPDITFGVFVFPIFFVIFAP